jgi:hypothetical protein
MGESRTGHAAVDMRRGVTARATAARQHEHADHGDGQPIPTKRRDLFAPLHCPRGPRRLFLLIRQAYGPPRKAGSKELRRRRSNHPKTVVYQAGARTWASLLT